MLNGLVVHLALVGGGILHSLNGYWGWLIVRKLTSKWRDDDGVGAHSNEEGHYLKHANAHKAQ